MMSKNLLIKVSIERLESQDEGIQQKNVSFLGPICISFVSVPNPDISLFEVFIKKGHSGQFFVV